MTEQKSAWYWPVRALIVLVALVVVGTALAIILSGCAPQSGGGLPAPAAPKTVDQATDSTGFTEHKVTLSDGRVVTCLTWSDHSLMTGATSSGLSCDWKVAE